MVYDRASLNTPPGEFRNLGEDTKERIIYEVYRKDGGEMTAMIRWQLLLCARRLSDVMKVYNPEDMNAAFAEAFNSGDIENLVSLYEPGAVLVPRPGLVVEGVEDIRAALRELLALKGVMRSENQYALVHGDIALLRAKVHLVGTAPDGGRVEINNHTAEVIRRQPDGSWLYILDHPYGADPLDTTAA